MIWFTSHTQVLALAFSFSRTTLELQLQTKYPNSIDLIPMLGLPGEPRSEKTSLTLKKTSLAFLPIHIAIEKVFSSKQEEGKKGHKEP